jgi:hypothetical protein
MQIRIEREVLTDRSLVFNVFVGYSDNSARIKFHAVDELAAEGFANELQSLIDRYTTD